MCQLSFKFVSMQQIFKAHPTLDGFLITEPNNIFWLSGFDGSFGKILCLKNGTKYLISDGRYTEIGQKIAEKNGFEFVLYNAEFKTEFAGKFSGNIGVESSLSLFEFEKLKQTFPACTLMPQTNMIEAFRRAKTAIEIYKIRQAQAHVDQILIPFLKENLRLGITEAQLNFKLQQALQDQGKYGLSFPSIVAFAGNSAKPHAVSGDTKLKLGDNILVDCGVTLDHYCSDMTRNFYLEFPHQHILRNMNCWLRSKIKRIKR